MCLPIIFGVFWGSYLSESVSAGSDLGLSRSSSAWSRPSFISSLGFSSSILACLSRDIPAIVASCAADVVLSF